MAIVPKLPVNKNIQQITYHRNPTAAEIKFGYGAIHYKEFEVGQCLNKDGRIKKRIKCKQDGLMYSY
jgi:hypothetical protein